MPLSSLWEQWGLLGLLVGLAATGAFDLSANFEVVRDFVQQLTAGVDFDVKETAEQLEAALSDGSGALEASASSSLASLQQAGEGVAQVADEEAFAGGLGSMEAMETAFDIALSSGAFVVRTAAAGAIGGVAGLAGLVVEGTSEAKSEARQRAASEAPLQPPGGGTAFTELGEFMHGTSSRHGQDDDQERPGSALQLGMANAQNEWRQLLRAASFQTPVRQVVDFVPRLVLSNEAVVARELARPEVPTPVPVKIAYDVLCWFIDVVFEDRPVQRFWFLETVARMPYFAYTSVLHLYETLGWWRSPELRAVHNAQEDNELHHLLIMESLGGDQRWLDRFFAQHGAVLYYWILIAFFLIDPRWSYNFSRLIEAHAVDTYGEFVDANRELLKKLPPPPVAVEYYLADDFYLFDKFQTAPRTELRRPPCATMFDVFSNICDDEKQHVHTMNACEEWVAGGKPAVPVGFNRLEKDEYERLVSASPEGRAAWEAWGREVSDAGREAGRLLGFREFEGAVGAGSRDEASH